MKADGEGDYFNEIAEEELGCGSGHLGAEWSIFIGRDCRGLALIGRELHTL